MRLHASADALQADHVKFPNPSFSRTDALMIGQPHVLMFRSHKIERGGVFDSLPGIGAYHRQPGGVHLQESTVSGDHLDTLRAGQRHRSKQLAARVHIAAGERIYRKRFAAEHSFLSPNPARKVLPIYTDPLRLTSA